MKVQRFWKPESKSASADSQKSGLSKSVMAMKFMQRKEIEKQDQNAVKNSVKVLNNMAWGEQLQASKPPVVPSLEVGQGDATPLWNIQFYDPYALLPGRRSFGGCNKTVEANYSKIFDDERQNRRAAGYLGTEEKDKDDEMLRRYESLVSLPRGPNQGMKPAKAGQSKSKLNGAVVNHSTSSKVMKAVQSQHDRGGEGSATSRSLAGDNDRKRKSDVRDRDKQFIKRKRNGK